MVDNSKLDITVEDAALAFTALGSEQRLGVLQALVRAGPEGLSIGELGKRSGVSGSTLTHHLRFLTHAELVIQERQGRSIICAAVAYDMIDALTGFLTRNCCVDECCADEEFTDRIEYSMDCCVA